MGKLILCSSQLAKRPYYFRETKTNVYSMEEVCYYIKNNIYIMQEEIYNRELAFWIRDELGMQDIADKIERLITNRYGLKDIVVTLCCSCDYFTEEELNALIQVMDQTENLPLRGRQKIKADNYLQCQDFEKALKEYESILKSDDMLQADMAEYGEVYHNMGVAFAGIGDLHKAAESFLNAFEKNHREESRQQYLFALTLQGETQEYQKAVKRLELDEMQRQQIEDVYEATERKCLNSQEYQRVDKLNALREAGRIEEYSIKVNECILGWKEEYRSQLGIMGS